MAGVRGMDGQLLLRYIFTVHSLMTAVIPAMPGLLAQSRPDSNLTIPPYCSPIKGQFQPEIATFRLACA